MLPATASSTIYIDVSDLVLYATLHDRVSGIQRVVLNVVRHLAATSPQNIICIFHDQRLGITMACHPADLLGPEAEFDACAMQYRLHQDTQGWIFPGKRAVRKYLRAQGYAGVQRFVKKCQILLAAMIAPRSLEKLGVRTPRRIRDANQRATLWPVTSLDRGAKLVLLGATWACDAVTEIANYHRHQGGTVVQMVHDLIPYLRPGDCNNKFAQKFAVWLHQAAKYATRFICISEHSACDLRNFLADRQPDAKQDIQVIPLAHEFPGFERNSTDVIDELLAASIDRDFVLFVGTIEPRKNCMVLLRTWHELQRQLGDAAPMLVIAGKAGWRSDDIKAYLSSNPELCAIVRMLNSPSDSQVAWLYANCAFTIFPSLYEGWGLPVGEAAWFGKYTLASKYSSIPEVLGDLVDYVDPEDHAELLEKTLFLIRNPEYLRRKMQMIRSAPLRSWEEMTAQVAAVLTQGGAMQYRQQALPRRAQSANPEPELPRQRPTLKVVFK